MSIARALSTHLYSSTALIEPDLNLSLPDLLKPSAAAKRPDTVVLSTHLPHKHLALVLQWMQRYASSGGIEKGLSMPKGVGKAKFESVDLWLLRDAALFLGVETMLEELGIAIEKLEERLVDRREVEEVFETFEEGHEARKSVLRGWAHKVANGKVVKPDESRLEQVKKVAGVEELLKALLKNAWDEVEGEEAPEDVVREEEELRQQGTIRDLAKMALEGLKKFPI